MFLAVGLAVAAGLGVGVAVVTSGTQPVAATAATGRPAATTDAGGPGPAAPVPAAPAEAAPPATGPAPGGDGPAGSAAGAARPKHGAGRVASRRVTFAGVGLPLPAGWRLTVTSGHGGLRVGCVQPGRAAEPASLQGCTLLVQVLNGDPPLSDDPGQAYYFANPDALGGFADGPGPVCRSGSNFRPLRPVRTAVAVDRRAGQFRSLVLDCATGADFAVQQWAFTDRPNVILTSYTAVGSPLQATVRQIVQAAGLPAGTGARTTDFGLLTGHRVDSRGASVLLDRELPLGLFTEHYDENDNPRVYPLRLAPRVVVFSVSSLCGTGFGTTTDRRGLGVQRCTRAQLQASLATRPAGPAWIKYDARGQVVAIVEVFRS
jgi:hypothetical protein